ncbi:SGNH/GDSL hydrolase family protein [Arcicella sp. DC2W]|uniref:SGNH/GDSL hydrolase family protein n=1 Tax=Arcicella gelida TaxID=2984195 RepID=A0ABU5S5M0_9BACT|nr:SGNH/GDSL hydrolase family protein [Arcicella sp. DC2W]MEA5403795.1 SGNH/GDSL hydrolase family protein [Arcicella sp. DC2W]
MKKSIFSLFLILAASIAFAQVAPQPLFKPEVKKVLFLGNSITYAGNYVNDIEAYCIAHFPNQKIEFINVGLPSETVSGLSEEGHADGRFPRPDLHERLSRVLAKTKPDLVFASYGMNDGIYLPLDLVRFQKFKDGIQWLHDKVVASGAKIIHLTPPIYDEARGKKIGYSDVLDAYSDWLLSQVKTVKWEVIDVHYPMQRVLDAHRRLDQRIGIESNFTLANDGIHPAEAGHWIMAKSILMHLGAKEIIKAGTIQATLTNIENPDAFMKLITERQNILKDAWLTNIGHSRPEMNKGLPLEEAQTKAAELEVQIREMVR